MKFLLLILPVVFILSASLSCSQGSILNSHSICISPRYIEGCSQYLNDHQCAACNYRYTLQTNGLCEFNPKTTQDCCSVRAANKLCITCQTGLYLIAGRCTQSNIIGCLEKDKSGVCINCAADFILKDGSCGKAIRNCLKYTDTTNTVCTLCKPDHSLTHNLCVRNQILGCKLQENFICKQCFKPFILQRDRCQIQNCQTYDEYNCVACQCGYYLDNSGLCKQMEFGCERYNRGVCRDCLPGFRLKGNHCEMQGCIQKEGIKCKSCQDNYVAVNGICRMKNCFSWKDGSCLICEEGFNYYLGNCIEGKRIVSE